MIRRAFILALVVAALPAVALASNQWSNFHWPSFNHAPGLVNKTDPEYPVAQVLADWAEVNGLVTPDLGGGDDIEVRSKNINALYLGIAEILVEVDTGHILSGRATVNDRYLKEGNKYGFDEADRKYVLCQEMLHVIGALDHQDDPKSCMNAALVLRGDDQQVSPTKLDATTPIQHDGDRGVLNHTDHLDDPPAEPPPDDGNGGGGKCPPGNPDHKNCTGVRWVVVHILWYEPGE